MAKIDIKNYNTTLEPSVLLRAAEPALVVSDARGGGACVGDNVAMLRAAGGARGSGAQGSGARGLSGRWATLRKP